MSRDLCFRCLKPRSTCYCARLRPFRTEAEFVFLQHPLERKRSVGTARMAHNCLQGSRLIQGSSFEAPSRAYEKVKDLIDDPSRYCMMLFPGKQAHVLGTGPLEIPIGRRLTIFVIDGTWDCAKTMIRLSPVLLTLPQLCFPPGGSPSEYRFREQPAPHCLSTIESVHRALSFLEPRTDAGILLDLFRAMVAEQIKFGELDLIRVKQADRGVRLPAHREAELES